MEELKKCPFCGGKAYFRTTTSGYQNDMRKIGFQIECRKCGASFPKTYKIEIGINEKGEIKTTIDERTKAIEAWNWRHRD